MGSPNPNSYVANDIVEAILLKLPVRSLLRFKTISNHFLSLISSPRFISAHHQNSKSRPSSIIFLSYGTFSVCSNPGTAPVLQGLDRPHIDRMELVGCANGLVCIKEISNTERKTLTIWNPATKQSRREILRLDYFCTIIGFGYHAGIEDYKLFTMPGKVARSMFKPQVLHLRRDTLREIDTCIGLEQNIFYHYCSAVVAAGVWYQVCDADYEPSILSFDLKDDSFDLIDPPFSGGEILNGVSLGVRDEKLCSFALSIDLQCRGWMMVEEASWVEMFTIDLCFTLWTPVAHSLKLRSTWQGARLLLENLTSFYFIDITLGSLLPRSVTQMNEVPKIYSFLTINEAYDFVESLVSPIFLEI